MFEYRMSQWNHWRILNSSIVNGFPTINCILQRVSPQLFMVWQWFLDSLQLWLHTRKKEIPQPTANLCRSWRIWLKGEIIQPHDGVGDVVLHNFFSLGMFKYWIFMFCWLFHKICLLNFYLFIFRLVARGLPYSVEILCRLWICRQNFLLWRRY